MPSLCQLSSSNPGMCRVKRTLLADETAVAHLLLCVLSLELQHIDKVLQGTYSSSTRQFVEAPLYNRGKREGTH